MMTEKRTDIQTGKGGRERIKSEREERERKREVERKREGRKSQPGGRGWLEP